MMLSLGMKLFITISLEALIVVTQQAGNHRECITSTAVVGSSGSMTFYFRKGLDIYSEKFHAYVKKNGQTANVLHCDKKNGAAITCEIINKAFNPTTIVNHVLTLTAPNVTKDLAGVYTLRAVVNGSGESAVECNFVVKDGSDGGDQTVTIVAVSVVCICLILAAATITIVFLMKRRRRQKANDTELGEVDESRDLPILGNVTTTKSGESAEPLLNFEAQNKRWYCEEIPEDEDLLQSYRDRKGSFFIAKYDADPRFLIIAVRAGDAIKKFRIGLVEHEESTDSDTGQRFNTLLALVEHYRNHKIKIGETDYGKLTKPFEPIPTEEWYVKPKDLKKWSKSKDIADGFLISDHTSKDCYVLTVKKHDKPYRYHIDADDDGFTFREARETFPTLSALVDNYRNNPIQFEGTDGNRILGTLSVEGRTWCNCI